MGGKAEGRLVVSPIRLPFLAAAYKNKVFFFKTILKKKTFSQQNIQRKTQSCRLRGAVHNHWNSLNPMGLKSHERKAYYQINWLIFNNLQNSMTNITTVFFLLKPAVWTTGGPDGWVPGNWTSRAFFFCRALITISQIWALWPKVESVHTDY